MIQGDRVSEFVKKLPLEFPLLFDDRIGLFNKDIVDDIRFTSEPKMIFYKQRQLVGKEFEAVREAVREWETKGVVRRIRHTPRVVLPLVITKKPRSDKIRVCLDYRLLNASIDPIFCPTIDRTRLLKSIKGHAIFSKIDISDAFMSIGVARPLQDLFAFEFDGGYFVFTRLKEGFHNSMAYYIRAIHATMTDVRQKLPPGTSIYIYVDDIAIGSDNLADHMHALKLVFAALQDDGWVLRLAKCSFCVSEILFLGVRLSPKGVFLDTQTLDRLQDLPQPRCHQDLRGFFGLCVGLNDFYHDLQRHIEPLRAFRGQPADVFQSPRFTSVWRTVLTTVTKGWWHIDYFDDKSQDPLTVFLDSSKVGHGGALLQGPKLLQLFSTANVKPWSSSAHAEMDGFCRVLRAFSPFLAGRPFHVFTDNRAVLSAYHPANHSSFILRRLDDLAHLHLHPVSVRHIEGRRNLLADTLSRYHYFHAQRKNISSPRPNDPATSPPTSSLPTNSATSPTSSPPPLLTIASTLPNVPIHRTLRATDIRRKDIPAFWLRFLHEDSFFGPIVAHLTIGPTESDDDNHVSKLALRYRMKEGRLFFVTKEGRWKLAIPQALVRTFLEEAHDKAGHYGVEKVTWRLNGSFFWPTLHKDVADYVRSCPDCQVFSRAWKTAPPGSNVAYEPWEMVAVDFVGPMKSDDPQQRYLLTCVDYLTKWPEVATTATTDSESVIRLLEEIRGRFGRPEVLMSDNDSAFTSHRMQEYLSSHNVAWHPAPAYSPKSNGAVERLNNTLVKRLQMLCRSKPREWFRYVSDAVVAVRCMKHDTTGYTPSELLLGWTPKQGFLDVMERQKIGTKQLSTVARENTLDYLQEIRLDAILRTRKDHNARRQTAEAKQRFIAMKTFEEGDLVLVRNNKRDNQHGEKFSAYWIGPYRIFQRLGSSVFQLSHNGVLLTGTFHHDRLRRFYGRTEA